MDEEGKGSLTADSGFKKGNDGKFHGDFRTVNASPARQAACTIELDGNDGLTCTKKPKAQSPDIGAWQSNSHFGNPYYTLPVTLPMDRISVW
jgi:hypothetical protein